MYLQALCNVSGCQVDGGGVCDNEYEVSSKAIAVNVAERCVFTVYVDENKRLEFLCLASHLLILVKVGPEVSNNSASDSLRLTFHGGPRAIFLSACLFLLNITFNCLIYKDINGSNVNITAMNGSSVGCADY